MGFFDSIKNALGGGDKSSEGVKGPSMVLREAGIDPANIKFDIKGDGSVTVNGWVDSQVTSDRVTELLGKIPSVKVVHNNLQIGAPVVKDAAPAEPAAATEAAETVPDVAPANEPTEAVPEPDPVAVANTYTVQPGDSLWKIAAAELGSGARYMEIFQANTDILENPDLIKPGQVLKIPAA